MLKRYRWPIAALAMVALLPIVAVIVVANYDWNRAKPWVEGKLARALGRSVALGDLHAVFHGWRRFDGHSHFSPGFSFFAHGVEIGNPDWAKRPQFARLDGIGVDIDVLPLLSHRLHIPSIRLKNPSIDLERRADDGNTWTFVPEAGGDSAAWTVELNEIAFDAGDVTVADAKRGLDLHADISALPEPIAYGERVEGDDPTTRREVIERVGKAAASRLHEASKARLERRKARGRDVTPPPYVFAWKARGTLRGQKVSGDGRFGGVFAIADPDKPFPLRADVSVGATDIALTGLIVDPTSPDSIDMRLWISGRDLSELYPIAGITMPKSPPYATTGRLAGRFRPHQSRLIYQDFTARVGGSDLMGTLKYQSAEPRPLLTGEVESTLLQFKDLGVVIGVRSGAAAAGARLLPDDPFNVEHWTAMDADVHFTGKRVMRDTELPIDDVDTRIVMKAGRLDLDPLGFGMAGGKVAASLAIDAAAKPPAGQIDIKASALDLHKLLRNVAAFDDIRGVVNGSLRLAGRGRSIAAQLGTGDGSVKVVMTRGRISETLLEEAGLNLANALLAKLRGDRDVAIDCAAADFAAKGGVLDAKVFVFDTDNALVNIDGTVDLGRERVDLTVHPHTKSARVFSLRSPLHVTGSFRGLDVSVDRKSLFARGAIAVGLGVVATPLAALIPLVVPSRDQAQTCAPLLEKLKGAGTDAATRPPRRNAQSRASAKR